MGGTVLPRATQRPPTWIARAGAASGLNQKQIDELLVARETGAFPLASDWPTRDREQSIRTEDQLRATADAMAEIRKRRDEQQKKEENDG
jgi:hypothetical protein